MGCFFVYSEGYSLPWGGHIFPVAKYRRTFERLLAEGIARTGELAEPLPATREELERVHSPEYLDELEELAQVGVGAESVFEAPLTREVLSAVKLATGGTLLACRLALSDGRGCAMNLSGGFHHASSDRGEGFCFVNDIAVAAAAVLEEGLARRVMIVDCDVHQGNGTSRIFRSDARVFTLDIHERDNYPRKERSSLDIALPSGTGDEDYLRLLGGALQEHLRRFSPDLVIYQAGADPYLGDRLGGLALTKQGLARRDELVFGAARGAGAAVAVVLGGGYPERLEDVVEIHVETARKMKVAAG